MNRSSNREVAALLALAELASPHLSDRRASQLAEAFNRFNLEILTADLGELDGADHLESCRRELTSTQIETWRARLGALATAGITAILLCDANYPINLRMVFDRPPLLFTRGRIDLADQKAVAVVGTRNPSNEGTEMAVTLSRELAYRGVTVISGMAAGIDTAAHVGALNAGGRTIAVLGQGLSVRLTAERSVLARAIAANGAVVSQFWPTRVGAPWTFPIRNRVTSGLSLATVVVEAGPTSGAKLQAHDALRHGKRVFLVEQLVLHQEWARQLGDHPAVTVLTDVNQIIDAIDVDLSASEGVFV